MGNIHFYELCRIRRVMQWQAFEAQYKSMGVSLVDIGHCVKVQSVYVNGMKIQ